ncbi:Protein phosphatase PHLPP-like protein [Blattella germanica]|nr:Protein phosphatase PHLPP-like protein [Blattella germanica]
MVVTSQTLPCAAIMAEEDDDDHLEQDSLEERLPDSLGRFTHVQDLNLGRNRLNGADLIVLTQLPRLKALQLHGNALRSLPAHLLSLRTLANLDLSDNALSDLPSDIKNLSSLEELRLDRNALCQLPVSLCHMTKLRSLLVGYNKLSVLPEQLFSMKALTHLNLTQLDVSENSIESLDLSALTKLETLQCSRNKLIELSLCGKTLTSLIAGNNRLQKLHISPPPANLKHLDVSYNDLATLPDWTAGCTQLRALFASHNKLQGLPQHLFCSETSSLQTLQLSYNQIQTLPSVLRQIPLQELFLQSNNLATLPNNFFSVTTRCIAVWSELEELVLSGNKLRNLPENIVQLEHLHVLRVHSNRLQTIPCFAKMSSLKVLDLAHNSLDRVNLATLVPQQLQFLDLSCNTKLYVDPRQFQVYRLYITQIRLPAFCNTEGLFGMFDGGNNNDIPNILTKIVPRMLLEERTVKETATEYMKYTMLSAHKELKENGQKYGVCGTLCHIVRMKPINPGGFLPTSRHQYVMRVASVGEARAVLCRQSGHLNLSQRTESSTNNPSHSQLGCSALFPLVIPDPYVTEVELQDTDESLIIANKRFWEVVSVEEAANQIRDVENAILAAKRLQDIAQSYGSEENLSVMVVQLGNVTRTDTEQVIRELRQTIRKSKPAVCQCHCCCGDKHKLIPVPDADRSSPSGQSDHTSSDCKASIFRSNLQDTTPKKLFPTLERRSYRDSKRSNSGVLKAIRSKMESYTNGHLADAEEDETGSDRSGTQVSEEQFKCWEYMLEQNTQLLFDKELDTLSRGFAKRGFRHTLEPAWSQTSSSFKHRGKALSRSSPHLSDSATVTSAPFLSRHFGSARSFHPPARTAMRFGSGRQKLNGGPNAAYFGSLQRLMPYNLEYNFSLIQERVAAQDSLEHDGRMQQYWGVTTTEL